MPLSHNGAQATFARALLQDDAIHSDLRLAHEGVDAIRRLHIYRNSVRAGLTATLAARFPAIYTLLGELFFRGLASEFLSAHPPTSPILSIYGGAFPGFLETFPEVRDVPYAADVARLEWAMHEALHSADASPSSLSDFARAPEDRLGKVRLALHPAARLVTSAYPVLSIWQAATDPGPDRNSELSGVENVLVTRPDLSVYATILTPDVAAFVSMLDRGMTLSEVMSETDDRFDLAAAMSQLFSAGAIGGVDIS